MDKRKLQKITQDYLETIANASDFNYVDEDQTISLTQVYVMLEAIKTHPPKAKGKRDDLPPIEERRQSAGFGETDETAQETRENPVLLSKVLNEINHLVLLGEPGAGKTTTLNFIGLCFAKQDQGWAEENLQLRETRIPIKLQLQVYSDHLASRSAQMVSALASEVFSRLQTIRQEESGEVIKKWLETGNLLILLDGLDEVHRNRADVINSIRQFVESPAGKSARIVLTSRLAGYVTQGGTFKEYTLKPLQTDKEAKRFLHGWLTSLKPEWKGEIDQKGEELLAQLQAQPALKRLLNNPLILRMAAQQYASNEKIASNRAQLYKDYIEVEAWQRALRRGAQETSKKEALAALEELAWESQMGNSLTEEQAALILQDKKYNLINGESKAKELLELVREKMGILVLVEQNFVFSHTTFREYFVARRLDRAWKNGKNGQRLTWKFLRPRLHLSAWRESLLLFSSLLDNEKETIDFIDRIYFAESPYENRNCSRL